MVEVHELVDQGIREKVDREVISQGSALSCQEIQPENSEQVGRGTARCVFEKNGYIVKIPNTYEGVTQTNGAKVVKEMVDEKEEVVATPLAVEEGRVVVQEKVTPYSNKHEFEKLDKIMEAKGDEEKIREEEPRFKELEERLGNLNITCHDHKNPTNWGVKNNKLVLLDLGECW